MARSVLFLIATLCLTAVAFADDPKPEAGKLQGRWVCWGGGGKTNPEFEGKVPFPSRDAKTTLEIDKGNWKLTAGKQSWEGTLTTDFTKTPTEVTLVVKGTKPLVLQGIVTPLKDRNWALALNYPGNGRPKDRDSADFSFNWGPAQ
jgi:hypothetical protein